MLSVKLPSRIETRLAKAAQRTGKTPDALTMAAVELYLEELEDYFDVMKRKNERSVTLAQLEKELGLAG
jgi:predicted DNA-binding protein